jgi:DNA topoisomerase I
MKNRGTPVVLRKGQSICLLMVMVSTVAEITSPTASAESAGLKYVSEQHPGIQRTGTTSDNFRYRKAGRAVRDAETLKRIRSLVIPPAWSDVWISADPNGHIQAVGRDARGRKQYRYHPRWRQTRDGTKYHRMILFGECLPRIRARISRDLSIDKLQRNKVLATIVRLLAETSIRVGNEEYSRHNNSFGLTTLRGRHVRVSGSKIQFFFRGKGGIHHAISLEDRRMAKIVRRLRDLPGYELFQYVENGETHSIGSVDVNAYIREISGEDFTAKDFRTWNGTVLAADALRKMEPCASIARRKKNIVRAVEKVADHLGNTVAVCRKCYIHPSVLDAYMADILDRNLKYTISTVGLTRNEAAVLRFLRKAGKQRDSLSQELRRSLQKQRKGMSRLKARRS